VPLNESPRASDNIAVFGGEKDALASKLDYSVSLPGQQRNRRVMELTDLVAAGRFKEGQGNLAASISLHPQPGGTYTFDRGSALRLWFSTAIANGVPGDKVAELERYLAVSTQQMRGGSPIRSKLVKAEEAESFRRQLLFGPGETATGVRIGSTGVPVGLTPVPGGAPPPELLALLPEFLDQLTVGNFRSPRGDTSGGTVTDDIPIARAPTPRLFLVEYWAVSSFLGNYGLGRTVKTMTLLPGEQLTLRLRTWRSSEQSIKDASSVFDSATSEAQDRFQSQVQRETTDKQTTTKTEEWHAEARVDASWGFGSAEVAGGGSGQYHSGREQFSSQLNNATNEHARTESNKRETTITSSSERSETAEDEEVTERVIRNVNLRHTLNFVFRELNQEYNTYVHLLDIRVAYTDGTPNSWREVAISDLGRLLNDVLVDAVAAAVAARAILKVAFRVFDVDGNPATVLEKRTWNEADQTWSAPADASLRRGKVDAPSDTLYYRFKKGPLGTVQGEPNAQVDGVVLQFDTVTLRTDSVIGEALLGEGDALDEYAMISQRADADAKAITNQRNRLVNKSLAQLGDAARVDAYVQMLRSGASRLEIKQV
jgi:hypothetical protein